MAGVKTKTEIDQIDGTPEKRLFLSIISDYDLKTGLCELIDNALDQWVLNGKKTELSISVELASSRQIISVTDNAGGIKEAQLRLLVSPGASRNRPEDEVIGIFGVGGKRAGVALGEHVEIKTRFKREKSFQIDITSDWIELPDWHIPAYEISDIAASSTQVTISQLRQSFDDDDVENIRKHLSQTYGRFIREGCNIVLNKTPLKPKGFANWAYPSGYNPKFCKFTIKPDGENSLEVRMTAGLIRDREAEEDNYGVYFYCNDRLIVKELKTRDVGYFVSGEAGVPHPDASLCRVIVQLDGPAQLMPWNSSKSGINFSHAAFQQIRPTLIQLVSYFSSLSRRLKHEWDAKVFAFPSGRKEQISPAALSNKRLVLPKLPRVNKPKIETLKSKNRKILEDKPWTLGLVESMGFLETISKQKLITKNRISLILLDSNFEISLKEFIVNRSDLFPPNQYRDARILSIFQSRHQVIQEVTQHVSIPSTLLAKANYYYNMRNKLIHERATADISDHHIGDYKQTIEKILGLLFGLKF